MPYDNQPRKIAVVTEANAGVGACIAVTLANSGMIVIGLALQTHLVDKLNQEVTEVTGRIVSRRCDISNVENIENAFEWIKKEFKTIDILVNNAGMMTAAVLLDSSIDDIQDQFDVNVVRSCVCVREGIKMMKDTNKKGHIILTNSVLTQRIGDLPVPFFSIYPSIKYAITAMCQTVRQEIHDKKLSIKLSCITHGIVDTDALDIYKMSPLFDELPKLQVADVADAVMYTLQTPENVENITLQAIDYFENKTH